ncbi:hypothetical protein OEZ86_014405 [Tetradesmus obliquus]|nr:hypothetical protein OEZ86_014405 [Tetradesmus obliquus]
MSILVQVARVAGLSTAQPGKARGFARVDGQTLNPGLVLTEAQVHRLSLGCLSGHAASSTAKQQSSPDVDFSVHSRAPAGTRQATGTSISSMQPAPVKLLNSNVKIDLSELGSLNGPMIARAHLWRPVTAAVLFVEAVIAVSLPAVATSRLLRYAGSRSYVTQADCIRMAWMFFACAVFSQLVLFVVGLLWKARSYFARHESGDQRDAADALAVLGDALFLALEDVPQLIMQTVFWVSGMALLPAWVYGISTALSLLGLSFGVGHVALRVRRQGGGLKWCADLAAAWRLQLIVVTGGNQ